MNKLFIILCCSIVVWFCAALLCFTPGSIFVNCTSNTTNVSHVGLGVMHNRTSKHISLVVKRPTGFVWLTWMDIIAWSVWWRHQEHQATRDQQVWRTDLIKSIRVRLHILFTWQNVYVPYAGSAKRFIAHHTLIYADIICLTSGMRMRICDKSLGPGLQVKGPHSSGGSRSTRCSHSAVPSLSTSFCINTNMPNLVRAKRKLTSSKTRDFSGSSISKGPKIRNLSQMHEEKRLLDERRKNEKLRKFFVILWVYIQ